MGEASLAQNDIPWRQANSIPIPPKVNKAEELTYLSQTLT
jgi:hypothetical protein